MSVETIDLVGVKPDGTEDKLGKGVMPPSMKIPEILRDHGFTEGQGHWDDDFEMAQSAMQALVVWMLAQGWTPPPLRVGPVPCKGTNCKVIGHALPAEHSAECQARHDAAVDGASIETSENEARPYELPPIGAAAKFLAARGDHSDPMAGLPMLPEAVARLLPFDGGEA